MVCCWEAWCGTRRPSDDFVLGSPSVVLRRPDVVLDCISVCQKALV